MTASGPTDLETLIVAEASGIANAMIAIAKRAHSEEDVRHGCNSLLDAFIRRADLSIEGRHEYGIAGGRIDSKYARVIIEYKDSHGPNAITDSPRSQGAKQVATQLRKRFADLESAEHLSPAKLFGVGTDGDHVVFARFRSGYVDVEDPRPTTRHTVERILRALVSLGASGKPFTPAILATDFGSQSAAAQSGVRRLYRALASTRDPKALVLFKQWRILFGEVCGYDVDAEDVQIDALAATYGIDLPVRAAELLFALHTYYAIFIKFLAAEIASTFSPLATSAVKRCLASPSSMALLREMTTLEQGGIWSQLGIVNFLEGDLFSWYLAAWSNDVADSVRDVVRVLDEYDSATLSVDPSESRDLLKSLYQQLFPQSVRHDLGEYYTPDWVAEHVLDDIGYDGNPNVRVLDPACGSGTFVVAALNRARQWFTDHRHECGYDEPVLLDKLLNNIVGFDLNPLAVMASRTNYLIALRDLLRLSGRVELPIFLCDSVMTPADYDKDGYTFKFLELKTAVGPFKIPREAIQTRDHIARYAEAIEFCIRNRFTEQEFIDRCIEEGIPTTHADLHRGLYGAIKRLDTSKQNGIWARIIKNAFAPLFTERFNLVVGNPPWVNWESLPPEYRDDMKPIWKRYGLFTLGGTAARLGGGKKDLAMLFVFASVDKYLVDGGALGFVITQTVFKTAGAGDGFRRLAFQGQKVQKEGKEQQAKKAQTEQVYIQPTRVYDLCEVQIFEDATNRSAILLARRSNKPFKYPVPYYKWDGQARIAQELDLKEVKSLLTEHVLAAFPIDRANPGSPWFTAPKGVWQKIQDALGPSAYQAYAGCCTWLNGVFWVSPVEDSGKRPHAN